MLAVTNVQIMYDRAIQAVRDVSLEVNKGQIVALLGSNGAGKSTLLKAVSNVLYPERGEITEGSIVLDGRDLSRVRAHDIVRSGVIHVPEGRRLFPHLTVEENLRIGGFTVSAAERSRGIEQVYSLFPRLLEKRHAISGYLSGGEQQMVAIGRALIGKPKLLLLDEPSLGLAPKVIEEIFSAISRINRDDGLSILLVEQNAVLALGVCHHAYIMENGRIVLDGKPDAITGNADVKEFYLGFGDHGTRKDFREVKHYKRRKRWLS